MTQFDPLNYVHEWLDTNFAKPPNYPGVYFIYALGVGGYGPWCELLYIGSTNNLRRRLSGHPITKGYNPSGFRITYKETLDYRNIEKLAIRRFHPLANVNLQKKD